MSKPLSPASAAFDLPVNPAREGERRQAWVYRQLREAILGGALPAGARLPSSRMLAQRLQVSRSTVEVAFDQLRAEGYVAGIVGSGTYVSATLPDRFLRPARRAAPTARPGAAPAGPAATPDRPTARSPIHAPADGAFADRQPDATLFPLAEWRRHLLAAARRPSASAASEEGLLGTRALREQVVRYLGAARGITCDASQVLIVSGIRQALDLCGRVLLRPADTVLLEDPGYVHAAPLFAAYARRLLPLAVDGDGCPVPQARRHAGAKLLHLTPAHQSPTGVTMPVSRRLELLAWAQRQGAWLLEDDYDSEFNYRSAPLPALKSLDTADRVVHAGSFNKTLIADLRIGYLVLPRALVPSFAAASRVVGRAVGLIEQQALAAFIASGGLARHVRRARAVYAQRRERTLAALRGALAPLPLHTTGEHGGFHFVWWLPPALPLAPLRDEAAARGLQLQGIGDWCRRATMPPGVMLADTALPDALLDDALGRLRSAITAVKPPEPRGRSKARPAGRR